MFWATIFILMIISIMIFALYLNYLNEKRKDKLNELKEYISKYEKHLDLFEEKENSSFKKDGCDHIWNKPLFIFNKHRFCYDCLLNNNKFQKALKEAEKRLKRSHQAEKDYTAKLKEEVKNGHITFWNNSFWKFSEKKLREDFIEYWENKKITQDYKGDYMYCSNCDYEWQVKKNRGLPAKCGKCHRDFGVRLNKELSYKTKEKVTEGNPIHHLNGIFWKCQKCGKEFGFSNENEENCLKHEQKCSKGKK